MSSNHHLPRCPRCESRLFLESEYRGSQLLYFWECSVGCSRQWSMDLLPRTKVAGEYRTRAGRRSALIGVR